MNDRIHILGNRIDCFCNYEELYDYVRLQRGEGGYITVNNVHTMMEGYWSTSFQHILNSSILSVPDGKPLEIIGRLKGNKQISRLFGPTMMEHFIDWGRKDNMTHFFFGSSELTLNKLKAAILAKYPGAQIAGMLSPPFIPIKEWDNLELVNKILETKPDFIWVGLGAPKQENWMFENRYFFTKSISIGIGAGFDYLAGNTNHAPEWMKKAALEWLYRLYQEPKRLWKRYFKTIPPFIILAGLELTGLMRRK